MCVLLKVWFEVSRGEKGKSIKYPIAILCNNNENTERRINLELSDFTVALHHLDTKVSIARVHSILSELLPISAPQNLDFLSPFYVFKVRSSPGESFLSLVHLNNYNVIILKLLKCENYSAHKSLEHEKEKEATINDV